MIVVTGAAGVTGRAVIGALAGRGAAVRAFVSREGSAERVRAAGARAAVVGDLRSADDLRRAMRGAAAVHHICPNMSDADRLEAMFRYYDRHGLAAGSPRALESILGRPPVGFPAFVERFARNRHAS